MNSDPLTLTLSRGERGRVSVIPAKAGIQSRRRPVSIGWRWVSVIAFAFLWCAETPGAIPESATPEEILITPESLLSACVAGGNFLLRHQKPGGDFAYVYRPERDDYASGYNLLRHAGTCYALMELFQVTRDDRYRQAVDLALASLIEHASPLRPEHDKPDIEAIVTPGETRDKAKLGGAALTLLAMMKYQETTGDKKWRPRAKNLARFLLFRQEEDGHFKSRYWYQGEPGDDWDSEYYPGEAILALVRLYEREPDDRWLEAARRGADWLIDVRDKDMAEEDLPHDHWLLIGLNELYALTGKETYLTQSKKISSAIVKAQRKTHRNPEWVGTFNTPPRTAPVATRGEGLVARAELANLVGEPVEAYLEALDLMAKFLLRCQIDEEDSEKLPNAEMARGGFRESLLQWNVRIDYVQHSISMLLGLRRLLLQAESSGDSSK